MTMNTRKALIAIAMIALCCVGSVVTFSSDQPMSDDEATIRTLIGKLNLAWKSDKGVDIMRDVISDKAFAFAIRDPRNPGQALVLNRATFLRSLENMLKNNRPLRHVHITKSVTVAAPYGYELGVTEQTTAGGKSTSENVMLFLAKEDAGWRIISWTPADDAGKAIQQFVNSAAR